VAHAPPSTVKISRTFALPALSSEQLRIIEQVAALARERFAQRAAYYDEESCFPTENFQDLRSAGLLGLRVPTEYGGIGADHLTYALSLLEIAKACSSTALTFNMHSTDVGLLNEVGTEEQKAHYFSEIINNGRIIASVTSEPDSSFREKFVLQTRFIPVDGGYRVEGLKHFVSIGDKADYYFVTGILDGCDSADEGMLSALIPATQPGISVAGDWNVMGMRGTNSLSMRFDTLVDRSQLVGSGTPGEIFNADWSGFALGYVATYLGIGQAAFEYLLEFVQSNKSTPSNEPLSENPSTQRMIGELAEEIESARLMLFELAAARESGDRDRLPSLLNKAKYRATEAGVKAPLQAIRFVGGRGITKKLPLERWLRDAVAGLVMPPSNDRCLEVIGQRLLFEDPSRKSIQFR
jgi:alkylation response protein AidB-like acyl-CoA dehydrogenase